MRPEGMSAIHLGGVSKDAMLEAKAKLIQA